MNASSRRTTFTSVSLKSECSLRFAEPTVIQASSTIPTFAWTYTEFPPGWKSVQARKRASSAARFAASTSTPSCPRVSSLPLFGFARQDGDDPEVRVRWIDELVGEDRRQLRRPEELALEVHEPLGTAQRPHVALQDRELAARQSAIDVLGHGPHELRLEARPQAPGRAAAATARPIAAGSARRRRLTIGPSSRRHASCQPIPIRRSCELESSRFPANDVRSIPPT